MTIRHLKVFIKVAELSSISKAAEYFCVAQPSISETIKDLEGFYGVLLFERVNKTLMITKEGELLLSKAKEVVDSFDEFEELASGQEKKMKLKIGSTITFSQNLLHVLLDSLNEKYKDKLDISIKIDTPLELEKELVIGNVDVVFTEKLPNHKSINVIETANDTLAFVISPSSNIPSKMNLEDILNYDLLVREASSPSRYLLDNELELIGKRISKVKIESISNAAIIKFVLNNYGIGVLPYFSVKQLIKNKELKEIKLNKTITRSLYMLTNKNKKITGLTKSVLNDSYLLLKSIVK